MPEKAQSPQAVAYELMRLFLWADGKDIVTTGPVAQPSEKVATSKEIENAYDKAIGLTGK